MLLGLMKLPNVDLYVTGSSLKMLSKDIVTEFRDRGDEIRATPLTFDEYYAAYASEKRYAWCDFWFYGEIPYAFNSGTACKLSAERNSLMRCRDAAGNTSETGTCSL